VADSASQRFPYGRPQIRACLVPRTRRARHPRMQGPVVWCPAPACEPGPSRAKPPPRPGSPGTPKLTFSPEPGSRGAAASAREAKTWPAGARAISLGLPPIFAPFTAVYMCPPAATPLHSLLLVDCSSPAQQVLPLFSLPLLLVDCSLILH
jgi:hypothetical protein